MKKSEIIQILISEFRKFGYEGLSLAQISKATGLGKASMYHYFPGGKKEMAYEVMKAANNWIKTDVYASINNDLSPNEKLKNLMEILYEFYQGGENACLLDVMTIDNCSNDQFYLESKTILQSLTEIFQKLAVDFGESETNAKNTAYTVLSIIQGALIQSRILKNKEIFNIQFNFAKQIFQKNSFTS